MIYLITGATNVGKDRVAEYMIKELGFAPIISTTSRPMRPKETEGKEYYFLSSEEFLSRVEKGEFIEYRHYDTIVNNIPERWYYGVEKKYVPENKERSVGVIDFHGASEFIKYYGRDKIKLLFIRSSYDERVFRNMLRGDFDVSEWMRRNIEDSEWLYKALKEADHIIDNYGIDLPESPIESKFSKIDVTSAPVTLSFDITKRIVNGIVSQQDLKK